MRGFMEQCVELYWELTEKKVESLRSTATPSLDDHLLTAEDQVERGALAPIAAKVLMKVLYGTRMCRPDLLFAVCSLAREVTRWTRACDKRLRRLISYIQGTKTLSLYSTVGDPLEKCRLLLYSDADFAGNNADLSKSTSGLFLVMAGPNTFAPLLAVSKAQSATSHSSTESEVISLEYALRTEGMPALDFWDAVAPLYSTTSRSSRGGDPCYAKTRKRLKLKSRRPGGRRNTTQL